MHTVATIELNRRVFHPSQRLLQAATVVALVGGYAAGAVAAANDPPQAAAPADAADGQRRGLAALVRVNLPLTSGADAPLKLALSRARDQLLAEARRRGDGRRPVLGLRIAPSSMA